jgi:hypothetical protein
MNTNIQSFMLDNQGKTATSTTRSITDGTIVHVDFYRGNFLIGTATCAPLRARGRICGQTATRGRAKATDDKGAGLHRPHLNLFIILMTIPRNIGQPCPEGEDCGED